MKLDQIYNDAKALRDVVNTLLDFIDSEGLTNKAAEYLESELEMSKEDAYDLAEEGIQ